MKTAIKTIMTLVGLLLISVAVVVMVFASRIEGLVRHAVETHVSEALGVNVSIEGIRLAPAQLGVELVGLRVQNPIGFKEDSAIECGHILIQPDLKTLFADTVTINQILLNGLKVDLRYRAGEGSNLGNISRLSSQRAEPPKEGEKEKHLVQVKEVRSTGGSFEARSNLSLGVPLSLHLEPFTITNLGGGQPISSKQLSSILARSLVMETITLKGLLRPIVDLLRKETG